MMVSTKGRYALRVLIDLAEHQTDGYIPLKDTAARQEISEKYLEGIIKILVKAKLLEGVRGKGGGYRLTKAPEQYTVGSILRLTENSMAPVACLEPGSVLSPKSSLPSPKKGQPCGCPSPISISDSIPGNIVPNSRSPPSPSVQYAPP